LPRPATDLLGVGLYTNAEAARILHSADHKVRRWVEGYYRYGLADGRRHHAGVVSAELRKVGGHRLLTFVNLMELHLIKLFRDEGVRMTTIRKAAEMAGRRFGTDHPFALRRFDTDGRDIFVTLGADGSGGEYVQDAVTAQHVFDSMVRPFFLKVDDQQDEILRFWPLGRDSRVVLDPHRSFGQPIDAPTGVPTVVLFEALEVEGDPDHVARLYRVAVEAVLCAADFERGLAA
jgi:hypothetical protein